MTRPQNTTYLYVREGNRPKPTAVRPEPLHLPPPIEPSRPTARRPAVRLVRPVTSAASLDPRFALLLMPMSEAALIYKDIAAALRTARPDGGRVLVTALDRAVARTRTTLNVAAALVEDADFAAVVDLDPGAGVLASTLGVSSFPGLRSQAEARQRDPRRTLDLLHVAARVGALPLEADGRAPTQPELSSSLDLLDEVARWVFLDAAPLSEADPTHWRALGGAVVVVISPAQVPTAQAQISAALGDFAVLGVVIDAS